MTVTAATCRIRAAHVPHGQCPGTAPEFLSERVVVPVEYAAERARAALAAWDNRDHAGLYLDRAMALAETLRTLLAELDAETEHDVDCECAGRGVCESWNTVPSGARAE